MTVHFERASNGYDVYNVDDVARTCTCPDFKFRAQKQGTECKHLSYYETPEPAKVEESAGKAPIVGSDARIVEVTANGDSYLLAVTPGAETFSDLLETLISLADQGHEVTFKVTDKTVSVF